MQRIPAILALSLLLPACGGGEAEPETAQLPPVFVIGMDGLEWDVMLPLLKEGRL